MVISIQDSENRHDHYYFEIRILIKHPTVDPEYITAKMGFKPINSWKVGEQRLTPAGTILPGIHIDTMWGYLFEFRGQRSFFSSVKDVCQLLKERDGIVGFITSTGGSVDLIVHLPGFMNIGDSMNPADIEILQKMKIGLGLEILPDLQPR